MIKLHGMVLSNYYNIVKTALVEKGIPFELVSARPSQDAAYLAISPMGKIPCIQTEAGYLAETHAILDYLEEIKPTPAMLPADPFARAKVRELVQSIELYVELVARRGIGALFGQEVPASVKEEIARDLTKGIAAVSKLVKFSPWIAGNQFTYADLFGFWAFTLANLLGKQNAGIDVLASIPGAQAWYDTMAARDSIKQALADQAAARKPKA